MARSQADKDQIRRDYDPVAMLSKEHQAALETATAKIDQAIHSFGGDAGAMIRFDTRSPKGQWRVA